MKLRLTLSLILALALLALFINAHLAHFEDGSGRFELGQLVTVTYCVPGQLCWDD